MPKNRKNDRFAEINALRQKIGEVASMLAKGRELYRNNRLEEARQIFDEILKIQPLNSDAIHFLGLYCTRIGKREDGINLIKRSIELSPKNPAYYFNLLQQLFEIGKYEESAEAAKHLIELAEPSPDVYEAVAKPNYELGNHEIAVKYLEKAIEMAPEIACFHNTAGICYQAMNQMEKAEACYRRSIALDDKITAAHWNLFQALFIKGDFEHALPEIEWRPIHDEDLKVLPASKPLPEISVKNNGVLLITPEQGLGDCVQFARFIPEYSKGFSRTILQCPRALIKLLEKMPGIDQVIPIEGFDEKTIPHDFEVRIMSIANELNKAGRFSINPNPYLKADQEKNAYWNYSFNPCKFNVGIVWGGNTVHKNDKNRSLKSIFFSSLNGINDAEFYSLQKGPHADEFFDLAAIMPIVNLGPELNDFADTAALMTNLDLLISVDSAPLHVAGALGVKTWGLIPFNPDWRWQLDKEDTLWYSSMRLFRQKTKGDWADVFKRVRGELETTVQEKIKSL